MEHYQILKCPHCGCTNTSKNGKEKGVQRYRCNDEKCRKSFRENYIYNGWKKEVKEQIESMAMNGSGVRDTGRVLKIAPMTIINYFRKKK